MEKQYDMMNINWQLEENGFCVIPNVVEEHQCELWWLDYQMFWDTNAEYQRVHMGFNTHFIQKSYTNYLRMPWEVRTNSEILNFSKQLHNSDKIIMDFGSLIHAPILKKLKKWDYWVHCDQMLEIDQQNNLKMQLNLTENNFNMIRFYAGSHRLHQKIPVEDRKNGFVRIPENYLIESMSNGLVKPVDVPGKVGQLIVFDARTWHVGLHQKVDEERLVVNLAYQNMSRQTGPNRLKARLCFGNDRRQTSGSAHKLYLNPKNPRFSLADNSLIEKQNIDDLFSKISKLI